MAGIGPAIQATGITGGTSNSAKPGSLGAKNNKNGVAKLSAADLTDAKKKIKEGEDTGEVTTDEEKNTGETTKQTSASDAAKKAVETPRDRLVSHLDKMGAAIDKNREEMAGRSMEAQNAAAMGEQNKMAEMMAAAQQQAKPQAAPKAPSSGGSSAKPQNKPSQSSSEAAKKAAEKSAENDRKLQGQIKQVHEDNQKLAKRLKASENKQAETKKAETEKTDPQKLKEIKEELGLKDSPDASRSSSGDKALEGSTKAVSTENVMKLDKYVDDVMATNKNPEKDTALLAKLDLLAEKSGDKNIESIRDDFKAYVEGKSESRSIDDDSAQDFSSQKDLENYDSSSFSLNDELPRSEEQSLDLDRELDSFDDKIEQDLDKTLQETQDEIEEEIEEEIEQQIEEMIEEIDIEIE